MKKARKLNRKPIALLSSAVIATTMISPTSMQAFAASAQTAQSTQAADVESNKDAYPLTLETPIKELSQEDAISVEDYVGIIGDNPMVKDPDPQKIEPEKGPIEQFFVNLFETFMPESGTENESEGDGTRIEHIIVSWITEDTEDDGDPSRLSIIKTRDDKFDIRMRVEFSLSGQYAYEPGDIQISVPRTFVASRDGGKTFDDITLGIPEAPDTSGTFQYSEVGDNILITNCRKLSSTSSGMIEFTVHDLIPSKLSGGDGSQNPDSFGTPTQPFFANIEVTTHSGMLLEKTSNSIDAIFDTKTMIYSTTVKNEEHSEIWPDGTNTLDTWPLALRPADPRAYTYAKWSSYCNISAGSQPYTLKATISTENLGVTPILLGVYNNTTGELIKCEPGATSVEIEIPARELLGSTTTLGTLTIYTAYPASETPKTGDTYWFKVNGEYSLTDIDDLYTTTRANSAKISYRPYKWEYPTGHFGMDKYGWSLTTGDSNNKYSGDLNVLNNGEDIELGYKIQIRGFGLPWTWLDLDENGHPTDESEMYQQDYMMDMDDHTVNFNHQSEPITSDEYQFESLTFPVPWMYDYKYYERSAYGYFENGGKVAWGLVPTGSWGYVKKEVSDSNLEIKIFATTQGNEGGDLEDAHVATVIWTNGAPTVIPTAGSKATGQRSGSEITVNFGVPNVVGYRCEATTGDAACIFHVYPHMRLKATEKIMEQLPELFENADTPKAEIDNTMTLFAYTKNEHGIANDPVDATMNPTGTDIIEGAVSAVTPAKTLTGYENDVSHRQVNLHYTAKARVQTNTRTQTLYNRMVNEGVIAEEYGCTWYDLLPPGVSPITSSIKLRNGDRISWYKVIDNYKNSGRKLLIVKASLKPTYKTNTWTGDSLCAGMLGIYDQPEITFDATYPWEEAFIHGNEIINIVAYKSDNDSIGTRKEYQGEYDNAIAGPIYRNRTTKAAVEGVADILEDLDPACTTPSFVYARAPKNLSVDMSSLYNLNKQVSVNGNGIYGDGISTKDEGASTEEKTVYIDNAMNTYLGDIYTYRIMHTNAPNTRASDMVFYDKIESYYPGKDAAGDINSLDKGDAQWHGTFINVDTNSLYSIGIAPVVYYSTDPNIDLISEGSVDLDLSSPKWSTTCPADRTKVTAVAVDARTAQDGSAFQLDEGEVAQCFINMRAPVLYDKNGQEITEKFFDTVLEDAKTEGDENGFMGGAHAYNDVSMCGKLIDTRDGSIIDNTRKPIWNHYTKVGLLNYTADVKKTWNDDNDRDGLRKNAPVVELELYADGQPMNPVRKVSIDAEGKWSGNFGAVPRSNENGEQIIYSIVETPIAGYTPNVSMTEADGVVSFEVENVHEPEMIEIAGTKTWDDEHNLDDTRPGTITLVADGGGRDVYYKTVSGDRGAESWNWSMSVPKYTNHGETLIYTLKENYAEGYGFQVVPSAIDSAVASTVNADAVNTHYPYGDLKIEKNIENATEKAAETEFEFTVMLTNKSGDVITDIYPCTIYDAKGQKKEDTVLASGSSLKMRGGEYAVATDIPSETKYTITESRADGWTADEIEKTGSIKAQQTMTATFTNTYNAKGKFQPKGTKTLSGRTLYPRQFRFLVIDDETGATIGTPLNLADGTIAFSSIKYGPANIGTHHYTIKEDPEKQAPGYTLDDTVYGVTVVVSDKQGNGVLDVEYAYDNGVDAVEFHNEYHAEGSLAVRAWKELIGRDMVDGEFEFELVECDENGVISEGAARKAVAHNDGNGIIDFAVDFDETDVGKTYYYKMREVDGGDATIEYSDAGYVVKVSVFDNGNGTLSFDSKTLGDDGTGEGVTPVFTNEAKPGVLTVTKHVNDYTPPVPETPAGTVEEWVEVEPAPLDVTYRTSASKTHSGTWGNTYSWAESTDESGDTVWTSTNKGINSSNSYGYWTFTVERSTTISFDLVSDGESSYDYVIWDLAGPSPQNGNRKGSASANYQTVYCSITPGTYELALNYTKDVSAASGQDLGKVKNFKKDQQPYPPQNQYHIGKYPWDNDYPWSKYIDDDGTTIYKSDPNARSESCAYWHFEVDRKAAFGFDMYIVPKQDTNEYFDVEWSIRDSSGKQVASASYSKSNTEAYKWLSKSVVLQPGKYELAINSDPSYSSSSGSYVEVKNVGFPLPTPQEEDQFTFEIEFLTRPEIEPNASDWRYTITTADGDTAEVDGQSYVQEEASVQLNNENQPVETTEAIETVPQYSSAADHELEPSPQVAVSAPVEPVANIEDATISQLTPVPNNVVMNAVNTDTAKIEAKAVEIEGYTPPTLYLTPESDDIANGTWGTCDWRIDKNGAMYIGEGTAGDGDVLPWDDYRSSIVSLSADGIDFSTRTSTVSPFAGCANLENIQLHNITNINSAEMFRDCTSLSTVNINTMSTSSVANMFGGCTNISSFDFDNVGLTLQAEETAPMFGGTEEIEIGNVNMRNWTVGGTPPATTPLLAMVSIENLDMSGWAFNECTPQWAFFGAKVKNLNAQGWSFMQDPSQGMFTALGASLETLDVSNWDLSNVTQLTALCGNCALLKEIEGLDTWDVSNLVNVSYMFMGCAGLENQDFDLSKWDFDNRVNASYMFSGACIKTLTLSNPQLISSYFASSMKADKIIMNDFIVSQTIGGMPFAGANIGEIEASRWHIMDGVTCSEIFASGLKCNILYANDWHFDETGVASYTFAKGSQIDELQMNNWIIAGTDVVQTVLDNSSVYSSDLNKPTLEWLLNGSTVVKVSADNWQIGNNVNLQYVFCQSRGAEEIVARNWHAGINFNAPSMFSWHNDTPNTIDVSGWELTGMSNIQNMFYQNVETTTINMSNWVIHDGVNTNSLFYNDVHLEEFIYDNMQFLNGGYFGDVGGIFYNCQSIKNLYLSDWVVRDFRSYGSDSDFSNMKSLEEIDISGWNVRYGWRQSTWGCYDNSSSYQELRDVGAKRVIHKDFNKDLEYGTFTGYVYLCWDRLYNAEYIDLENWNVAGWKNLERAFDYMPKLKYLNLSGIYNTQEVTDVSQMFQGDTALEYVDITDLDTSNVTDFGQMFAGCSSLSGLDISNMNSSKLNNTNSYYYDNMFAGCGAAISRLRIDPDYYDSQWTVLRQACGHGVTLAMELPDGSGHLPVDPDLDTIEELYQYIQENPDNIEPIIGIWSAVEDTYRVNFNANGGSGSLNTAVWTELNSSANTFPQPPYVKYNDTVAGWSLDPDCDPNDKTGKLYALGSVIPQFLNDGQEEITLYAIWWGAEVPGEATNTSVRFKLKADETATFNYIPPGTQYVIRELDTNGYVLSTSYGTTGTVESGKSSSSAFVNTFSPDNGVATIEGTKTLDGEGVESGAYEFKLEPVGDAPMPAEAGTAGFVTTRNISGGAFSFPPITFPDTGTYYYKVTEVSGNNPNIIYDGTSWTARVNVWTNSSTMVYETSVSYTKEGDPYATYAKSAFDNHMKRAQITISKSVTGTAADDIAFPFTVSYTSPEGKKSFESFSICSGETHTFENVRYGTTYTIEESSIPSGYKLSSIKMDGAEIPAATKATGLVSKDETAIEFTNSYSTAGVFEIPAHKSIDGNILLVGSDFDFELFAADENGVPLGNAIATTSNDTSGKILFEKIAIPHVGDCFWVVREKTGNNPAFDYDKQEYVVKAVCSDKGDGTYNVDSISYYKRILDAAIGTSSIGEEARSAEFTNKVRSGNVVLAKNVINTPDNVRDASTFEFSASFKDLYNKDISIATYTLVDKNGNRTEQALDASGKFTLKASEKAEFALPFGTSYAFAETPHSNFVSEFDRSDGKGTVEVGKTTNITCTNTYKASASITLGATKKLRGGTLTNNQFFFELINDEGYVLGTLNNDAEGLITLPELSYTEADVNVEHDYFLVESTTDDKNIKFDTSAGHFRIIPVASDDGTIYCKVYTVDENNTAHLIGEGESASGANVYTFVNDALFTLPESGNDGITWAVCFGLALIALSCFGLSAMSVLKHRRRADS